MHHFVTPWQDQCPLRPTGCCLGTEDGGHDPTLRARPTQALSRLPGIRAFQSASFRLVLASTILAAVVALLLGALARQAADPLGQYGIDFAVYQQAARNMATGF